MVHSIERTANNTSLKDRLTANCPGGVWGTIWTRTGSSSPDGCFCRCSWFGIGRASDSKLIIDWGARRPSTVYKLGEYSEPGVSILEVHRLEDQAPVDCPGPVSADNGIGPHRHHIGALKNPSFSHLLPVPYRFASAGIEGTPGCVSLEHDLLSVSLTLPAEQSPIRMAGVVERCPGYLKTAISIWLPHSQRPRSPSD